jgi:hypothetical protein
VSKSVPECTLSPQKRRKGMVFIPVYTNFIGFDSVAFLFLRLPLFPARVEVKVFGKTLGESPELKKSSIICKIQ